MHARWYNIVYIKSTTLHIVGTQERSNRLVCKTQCFFLIIKVKIRGYAKRTCTIVVAE